MYDFYAIYLSLTQAQAAVRFLQEQGIIGEVVRAPKALSPLGCSYAVRMDGHMESSAKALLSFSSKAPFRYYRVGPGTRIEEVHS